MTLDISGVELTRRAKKFGLRLPQAVPVPFAVLPKGLLLDVDLLGDDGRPSSVLTSDEDAFASQLILAAIIKDETKSWPNQATLGAIYAVTRGEPSDSFTASQRDYLNSVCPHLALKFKYFSETFLMMTEVDAREPTSVLKYRLVETFDYGRRTLAEALCIASQYYYIDAPSVGRAQREHLRVTAPKGTFIESAKLYPVDDDQLGDEPLRYASRVTAERTVAYTSSFPDDDCFLLVTLRPVPRGSFTAAALWSLATFLIVTAGAVGEYFNHRSGSNSDLQIGPFLAALLTIFSLGSANVLRADEHELSGHVASRLRTLLLMSSVLSASAALSVVLDGWPLTFRLTWGAAWVSASITMLVVGTAWIRSWVALREVDSHSGKSTTLTLEPVGD